MHSGMRNFINRGSDPLKIFLKMRLSNIMIAIVLAAGYATRLYPLTENFPKPLLPVNEKPILNWLLDDLEEQEEITGYVIVSNHKFIGYFEGWKETLNYKKPVILVDDGSTDGSNALCDKLATEDARIRVIHKSNGGVSSARNVGIDAATSEYITFCDSDDYLEVSACEELLKLLTEHPVDVLHFGTVLHANENVSDDLKNWVTNFLTPYEGELEGNLIEKCFVDEKFDFNITNKIWRREVCEEAFANVEQIRLVASEDRYIFFLLMYYAKNYYGIIEKYYNYNLGIGVTGGDILSLDQFEKRCSGAEASELVKRFLEKQDQLKSSGKNQNVLRTRYCGIVWTAGIISWKKGRTAGI